ncbi:DUF5989 family protein [Nostoc sp.]|uniref:DUF5989 family protein n=1 Tax=Nostoc sp. TaxID=1180 RepID=UPI003FA5D0DD
MSLIVTLLLVSALIALAQSSVSAPFIYTTRQAMQHICRQFTRFWARFVRPFIS